MDKLNTTTHTHTPELAQILRWRHRTLETLTSLLISSRTNQNTLDPYGKEFPFPGGIILPATYGASPIPCGMEPAIKPQRAPGIFPAVL